MDFHIFIVLRQDQLAVPVQPDMLVANPKDYRLTLNGWPIRIVEIAEPEEPDYSEPGRN